MTDQALRVLIDKLRQLDCYSHVGSRIKLDILRREGMVYWSDLEPLIDELAALAAGLDAAPPLADLRAYVQHKRNCCREMALLVCDSESEAIKAAACTCGLDAALAHPPQGEMKGEKP